MERYRFIGAVLLLLPALVFGQAKVGTAAAQFLEIPVGARSVGMGDAFLATANDVSAVYYNPAGLTNLTRSEVGFTHNIWVAGISHDFAAFALPVRRLGGVLGISAIALTTGDMVERTIGQPEGTGRTFTASDLAVGITYSRKMTDRFSAGITWKYIGEYYADVKSHSWAADVGALYVTDFNGMRIGMNMSNFGPDITMLKNAYPLPMAFNAGLAMEAIESGPHKLTVGWNWSHPNDNLEKFQVGTEYWLDDMFAFRVGYKFGAWDADRFSVGIGTKIPVSTTTLKVDYAFSEMQELRFVHRFSLGAEF
jgi:hypothetical protein